MIPAREVLPAVLRVRRVPWVRVGRKAIRVLPVRPVVRKVIKVTPGPLVRRGRRVIKVIKVTLARVVRPVVRPVRLVL